MPASLLNPAAGLISLAMNRYISVYLDLVRFLAALIVFFVHANYDRFTSDLPVVWRFRDLGNDAVMIFFVLSGFVIAFVADQKEKTPRDYFVSRFARLYSVVVPALLFTIAIDHVGAYLVPGAYDGWWFQNTRAVWRMFANLFFVNELWFSSIRPFSNGPFWSLGYEFWYYTIFAAAFFLKRWVRYAVVAVLCLLVGPKILLLLPVWLLGVLVYHIIKKNRVSDVVAWVLFLVRHFYMACSDSMTDLMRFTGIWLVSSALCTCKIICAGRRNFRAVTSSECWLLRTLLAQPQSYLNLRG